MTTQITTAMMNKQEAKEKHAQIIELSCHYIDNVGPIALDMKQREGWRALGFKNWTDYCHHVDEKISAVHVMRLAQKAEVEQNVQARLPVRHALTLARLPFSEAQREVYAKVKSAYAEPVELNYQTYVEEWFRKHQPDAKSSAMGKRAGSDGWTRGDLEEDGELTQALDRIEEVYGHADRKAIQEGTVRLSRKELIALTAFHASKMNEVRYLIMVNRWRVDESFKFISKTPDSRTMIEELMNHCLTTPGLCYTCSVGSFDIQVKAGESLANKIKGLRNLPTTHV